MRGRSLRNLRNTPHDTTECDPDGLAVSKSFPDGMASDVTSPTDLPPISLKPVPAHILPGALPDQVIGLQDLPRALASFDFATKHRDRISSDIHDVKP